MLLNLSNHPSASWSKNQFGAAEKQYGKVADMSFPAIDPHWGRGEVFRLAEEYMFRILDFEPMVQTVHLMGELTFTHILVNMLAEIGIPCIASTTERHVTLGPDGSKTSTFRFIAFRSY